MKNKIIDALRLQNFQIHSDTFLKLSPNINVIIGETDQGKSCIAKALYWFFFNRPSGDEFITTGKKECSVTVFSDGDEVSRIRKVNGANLYTLNGKEFNALRTDVPEEIQQLVRVTDTNVQLQFDPPFLLDLSAGDVAKKLNQVIGISQIDSSLKFINHIIRGASSEYKFIKKEIEKRKTRLKKFAALGGIEEKHEKFLRVCEKIDTCNKKLDTLDNALSIMEQNEMINDVSKHVEIAQKSINEIQEITPLSDHCSNEINLIDSFMYQIEYLSDYLSTGEECLKKTEGVVLALEETFSKIHKTKQKISDINAYLVSLHRAKKEITEMKKEETKAINELEEWQNKLGICPLCGNSLGDDKCVLEF